MWRYQTLETKMYKRGGLFYRWTVESDGTGTVMLTGNWRSLHELSIFSCDGSFISRCETDICADRIGQAMYRTHVAWVYPNNLHFNLKMNTNSIECWIPLPFRIWVRFKQTIRLLILVWRLDLDTFQNRTYCLCSSEPSSYKPNSHLF